MLRLSDKFSAMADWAPNLRKTRLDYHQKRATRELDLGLRASNLAAARAHLRLSALHMDQVRDLSQGQWPTRPLLEM